MRVQKGLSQTEIAKLVGFTPHYYSYIENGKRQPDMAFSMMKKLATALGFPIQKIIDAESAYKANSA